jgi:hypothetical protein
MVPTDIGLTWKSNTIIEPVTHLPLRGEADFISFLNNPDPSILSPVLGGGIFDIEVFGIVPEPSSAILMLGLFLPLLGRTRPTSVSSRRTRPQSQESSVTLHSFGEEAGHSG